MFFSMETWIMIVSVFVLSWYYVHRKWQYLKKLNIPHEPPSLAKLGHMAVMLSQQKAFVYDNEMKRKFGPVWGSYTFLSPNITIHDPDILRQIFIKEFHAFPARQRRLVKLNGKEFSEALNAVEGRQWKRVRSTMTPTFSSAKLRQMTYIVDRCVDNAAAALDRKIKANQGVFNSKSIFSRLSLDVLCSAVFSTEVNSLDDMVKEPEIAIQAKKLFAGTLFSPLILFVILCPPLEKIMQFFHLSLVAREPINYFKALTHHVINEREADVNSEARRVDLMQLMLNSEISEKEAKSEKTEKGMDRTEIVGNSLLMIFAGYENTGNTMSFLAYSLAQYPDIQRKLQEEIDEMYSRKGTFDYESVGELKYLEMCINETLRLYMPILRNARICDKEITINGLTIPKGMKIDVPTYALAHDPDYWDEPHVFKPERFYYSSMFQNIEIAGIIALCVAMSDMSQIDPMMYQPFGAGPRNCIGLRFALMEIKMCMAKILHQFTFETSKDTPKPPLELAFGISVRSVVDYDLKAVRRTGRT